MMLSHLEITNFRNISKAIIDTDKQVNVFYGENGSGKTSLLEAIYHLSFGRSFRTRNYQNVIQNEAHHFTIFGMVEDTPIGIERNLAGQLNIHISKNNINSVTELTKYLPVILINPDSYQLINAGPKVRRQFLDWGVFHVEHSFFLTQWKRMQRIIKQRNTALKSGGIRYNDVFHWDEELIEASNAIDEMRKSYFLEFSIVFKEICRQLLDVKYDIEISYSNGWGGGSLEDKLKSSFNRDLIYGYTQNGPHRADLVLSINDVPVHEVLSRGQQKLLVCSLLLSQATILNTLTSISPVFLVDDLASELDKTKRELLCHTLIELGSQVFITGIDESAYDDVFDQSNVEMFHVEHGIIDIQTNVD